MKYESLPNLRPFVKIMSMERHKYVDCVIENQNNEIRCNIAFEGLWPRVETRSNFRI